MLYYLFYPLKEEWFGFNVFRYITFRAGMAIVTAFLLTLVVAPWAIRMLKRFRIEQPIRSKTEVGRLYDLHRHKDGTPTMGGIVILISWLGSTLLWSDFLGTPVVLLLVGLTLSMGLLGFLDDLTKLRHKTSRGLSALGRLFWQSVMGWVFVVLLLKIDPRFTTTVEVPFLKEAAFTLGFWMIPFAVLVLVGTANAVNLADGLDGLAIGCTAMIALCLAIFSYLAGHRVLADYLWIAYVPSAAEVTIFCAALVGASLGFLWYNAQPASLFMGDTGSLALGAAIGAVAVVVKKELLLVLLGGIFVAEALSVILQVGSFRLLGRRIFRMAPLHHHFQLVGWQESKVTVRFWIVGAILALLSLGTLKVR
jgi:phospho-N-acetylmuramoyl-pentapeptide-transferase